MAKKSLQPSAGEELKGGGGIQARKLEVYSVLVGLIDNVILGVTFNRVDLFDRNDLFGEREFGK